MRTELKLPDGSTYRGEYKDNSGFIELSGEGHIAYPNGDKYVGTFINGNLTGNGTYIFKDGETHCGAFNCGIPNGVGLHEYIKGSVYIGNFEKGKRGGGYGLYCSQNGKIEFGLWENNSLIEDMSSHTRVVTQMSTSGLGIAQIQDNGGFYFGEEAYNNNPVLGIIFYPNGEVYIGNIRTGKREGYGQLFIKNNQITDGLWSNNILIGEF